MKFYDCKTAPSPRRVRIFLAEKDIAVETQQIDLRNGEQFGDEFREVNPDCTVPALVLDDGTVLTEVFAICQYIEAIHPEPPLMGRDAAERARVTMWNTKVEQQGLAAVAEAFRNNAKGFKNRAMTGPNDIEQLPQLVARGTDRVRQFFDRLDAHLEQHDYLAGDKFSIADITALVTLEFARGVKVEFGNERPNVDRWYGQVKERPACGI